MPRPLSEKVDPTKTALVVIDVKNDFCHPDGLFPQLGADISTMPPMAARIADLVAEARRLDILILWVRATYDPVVRGAALDDALDKSDQDPNACQTGTFGAEWYGEIVPDLDRPNEVEMTKHRYSAFWDSPIDLYLRSNAIENVILTGVITSGCVESTGRDAFFRNYFVVIPNDACASFSQERHDASLRKFAQTMGTVPSSEDVLGIWQTAGPGARGWHLDEKKKRVLRGLPDVIDPTNTALLIIDMQNDFCHPDGVMAQRGADISANQAIIPSIAAVLDDARTVGAMVLHVKQTTAPSPAHLPGCSATPKLRWRWILPTANMGRRTGHRACAATGRTHGHQNRYSAFVDTRLETILRSNGIRTVVVCGTATMACVESTVRDAMMRDYRAVVPRDAVAARGHMKALHDASGHDERVLCPHPDRR